MFRQLLLGLSLAMLLAGCDRGASAARPPSNSAPPPAPALQEVAPIVVDSNSDAAVACNQLTEALRKYALARKHMPASVDELLQAGYVRGVPAPPAGKQYALDLAHSAVVLVKK